MTPSTLPKHTKEAISNWFCKLLKDWYNIDAKIDCKEKLYTISINNNSVEIEVPVNELFYGVSESFGCAQFSDGCIELPMPAIDVSPNTYLDYFPDDKIVCRYDFIGLAYWCLHRVEELLTSAPKDAHGRFKATGSHAYKFEYLDLPIVDMHLDYVISKVCEKANFDIKCVLKHKKMLSHDVDFPSRYLYCDLFVFARRTLIDIFKQRKLSILINAISSRFISSEEISVKDPYNTFDYLYELANKYGYESTLFFMTGVSNRKYDGGYSVDDSRILKLISEAKANKVEIGIHPSFESYLCQKTIQREIDTLKRVLDTSNVPSRMHFLKWNQEITPDILDSCGVTYDSTLGYADSIGFRASTCRPYKFLRYDDGELSNMTLIPLLVMDKTLTDKKYSEISKYNNLESVKKIKAMVKEHSGVFSLLWHNSSLVIDEDRKLLELIVK
ncbi:polysaccharide deacetylase family protein [Vibrio sp. Vb2354]|uniref:polysaccharide deacetylase family protein n=1 Tax=unclassified Vibrio TaxID=2614977 RepID=UPI0029655573|nr:MULTISPECIES: polysaccharide deacetylase family protein [unclassified Vibrio]MDW1737812.1 polysaccharide deacetylase family protein [Vibrio sp. Vb2321]MDW1756932.1 polysaccharide deacetylase family protein [Vibrio sp. Vb2353]MDW1771235.1 polysaccharide deacetylase family protein [Vibrio sp. Vb2354]MDW1807559.1 polysaccharide deacetylase family protein [Vibrio sp. Vb2362]